MIASATTVRVARPSAPAETAELSIAYDRAGSGSPVLLVHGNFASERWWREQLADPPAGLDLLAPCLPGFARSSAMPDSWEESEWVYAWADALAGLARALGLSRVGVVGHSLGGAVAQALAVRHPGLVTALLLVDSAPPGGFVTPDTHYPVLERYRTDRELLGAALAAVSPTRRPEHFSPELVDDAAAMGERHYQGNARALAAYDLTSAAAGVEVPVTVLHGGKDLLIPAALAQRTASAYPNARLITWPDVGHSPLLEAPAEFRRLLAATFGKGAPMA